MLTLLLGVAQRGLTPVPLKLRRLVRWRDVPLPCGPGLHPSLHSQNGPCSAAPAPASAWVLVWPPLPERFGLLSSVHSPGTMLRSEVVPPSLGPVTPFCPQQGSCGEPMGQTHTLPTDGRSRDLCVGAPSRAPWSLPQTRN